MADRLYRSRTDRMLFGVAGGMARYFRIDPAIVRLVWVLLFLAVGAGFLLYIVAAIVIPEEPAGYQAPPGAGGQSAGSSPGGPSAPWQASPDQGANGAIILGLVLVGVGAWFLVQRLLPDFDDRLLWPIILVGIGLVLVVGAMRRR